MKKLFLFIIFLFLSGCNPFIKTWEETDVWYDYPNWTSDNKIVFLEWITESKVKKDIFWGGITSEVLWHEVWLWEVDTLQNYQKKGRVWRTEGYVKLPTNTSSAVDWVVIGVWDYKSGEIWKIRRDGTGAEIIGKGVYPDLSPDGSKLVYQKKYWDTQREEEVGQGLWIMNIDGTNEHQIVTDPDATTPAWSSDTQRIAYIKKTLSSLNTDSLVIIDATGNILSTFIIRITAPDWGPLDTNAISFSNGYYGCILYIESGVIDTLKNIPMGDALFLWSPSGSYFISYRTIYTRDGTKLFTIKP